MKYHCRAPEFDLDKNLHKQLISEIKSQTYVSSDIFHDRSNLKSDFLLINFLNKFLFTGDIRSHRLSDSMESMVKKHFQEFIDFVNLPCKIRFKTIKNTKWIPPHSDNGARYHGDLCSISIGVIVNNEKTNWYESCNFGKIKFLSKKETTKLIPACAYLFDNNSMHSVTECVPQKSRWLLSLSWQDIEYNQLCKLYETWKNKK
jgi:hypothetical protein